MEPNSPKSDFVRVNGIRLHYLDWGGSAHPEGVPGVSSSPALGVPAGAEGGSGPALVFIPGWGCAAQIFGRFAPRFTDRFRVLALTRRGSGDSDYPESGYDADTLAEDLRQFLDALGIERVILAGHSLAYIELSRFATLYPERVLKLVFLDAAYDRTTPAFKAAQAKNPLPGMIPPWPKENPATIEAYAAQVKWFYPSLAAVWGEELEENLRRSIRQDPDGSWVDKETEGIHQAIAETVASYAAPYAEIQAPVLSIFALRDGSDFLSNEYMSAEQRAQVLEFFKTEMMPHDLGCYEQFQAALPQARVAVIPNPPKGGVKAGGNHYLFIKHAEFVYNEMRAFLLD